MQVLMGWVGCQDRHLRKYSDVLNAAGFATLRTICPKLRLFAPIPAVRRAWAARVLDYVAATGLSDTR